jgi:galacturonokinase
MIGQDNTLATLRQQMFARFGAGPERIRFVRAPYRVCPLGAHIDHQLGTVTALAIDRAVVLAYAPTDSPEVRLGSLAYPGEVRFRIDAIPPRQPGDWGNYARGAAWALAASGGTSGGASGGASGGGPLARGLIGITSGELAEAGLSSSASIGLAYLLALADVNALRTSAARYIQLDQAIENGYLGLNNGILDQAAILLSRRDALTVIDCREFAEAAPDVDAAGEDAGTGSKLPVAPGTGSPASLPRGIRLVSRSAALPPFALLLAFSGLTKSVLNTDYNRRVTECEQAARLLLRAAGRPEAPAHLAEISPEEYAQHRRCLDGALARRAEHFFGEMERVACGVRAWERGELPEFGRLMTESGRSSIVNYECGCPPMIDLYEILVRSEGVLGARFSGAGFRGCCVALVEAAAVPQVCAQVQRDYALRHPEPPEFRGLGATAPCVACQPDDGAQLL